MARLTGRSLADIARDYVEIDADCKIADAALRQEIADLQIRWNALLLTARRAGEESKVQRASAERVRVSPTPN